jgi:hypothetical protein
MIRDVSRSPQSDDVAGDFARHDKTVERCCIDDGARTIRVEIAERMIREVG